MFGEYLKSTSGHVGRVIILCSLIQSAGCTLSTVKDTTDYVLSDRSALEKLNYWDFEGRIAVILKDDSWSGSMSWAQSGEQGVIKISGPLGQGGVEIKIKEGYLSINDGENVIDYSDQDEASLVNELGFYVPIRSLVYWVRGLADPDIDYIETDQGFMQSGWQVLFKAMQRTEVGLMPHKVYLTNQAVRLKLIVDQWVINE
ncbi:MAG: lipoprotein insertase outer membrane protein LolB [Methylicorpusculum sp.]|uniref:lipoprotein insertase outer membrane protein LolB n=1 Tax=Methylicorpusculum sp. TaxID=2713644 RepID=UPI00271D8BAC|nr:lipoprotein insertase outer membrane protein LolB [Methylicorpusculum sp.]MDO8844570.1 lipoprotein insertase outer membrane protein LolB [Methylicorpusculum sp.]MDO8938170.1 lipoprotein insertase outer membrane protein LolB [Methylicorpusculum sp.]MDP2200796.1 lipoprotein insertase outer membrane protein LolB [Methylicorpusculum sp.]MDZ4055469.1 lipoprotein insertase outer membrane protein LolB [Polynucleobacter sp.]